MRRIFKKICDMFSIGEDKAKDEENERSVKQRKLEDLEKLKKLHEKKKKIENFRSPGGQ